MIYYLLSVKKFLSFPTTTLRQRISVFTFSWYIDPSEIHALSGVEILALSEVEMHYFPFSCNDYLIKFSISKVTEAIELDIPIIPCNDMGSLSGFSGTTISHPGSIFAHRPVATLPFIYTT